MLLETVYNTQLWLFFIVTLGGRKQLVDFSVSDKMVRLHLMRTPLLK